MPIIEKMVDFAKANVGYNPFVFLFAITYIFLLRLPSEALPMCAGPCDDNNAQSVLSLENGELVLRLKRRKNRPLGGTLKRACWCSTAPKICPVHVFGRSISKVQGGVRIFPSITVARALTTLRFLLEKIGVEEPRDYRTHDLRRGHVLDLQQSGRAAHVSVHLLQMSLLGAPLPRIMEEAQWKPPAFMKYIDCGLLEHDAVVQVR